WVNSFANAPCGTPPPNRWGMFDMVGNVWELVWGRYDSLKGHEERNKLPEGLFFDWTGLESANDWIARGGAFDAGSYQCRSSYRSQWWGGDDGDGGVGRLWEGAHCGGGA